MARAFLSLVLGMLVTLEPAPQEKTGLQVGVKAPAFALKDQNDKDRRLEEFLHKGKVALVFYRSASW